MSPHSEKIIEYHQPPEWLNKEYLEMVLRNYKGDLSIKINNLEITPASAKGEHYASIMSKIKINYSCECNKTLTENFIVKSTIQDEKLIKDTHFFKNELDFYENIVPQINKLLNEINLSDNMFPEMIYIDQLHTALILEDLSIKSFKNVNRKEGLDNQHINISLNRIAKFHACTVVLDERYPGIFKDFNRGIFNRFSKAFAPVFELGLKECSESIRNFGDKYIEYGNKMEKLIPNIVDRLIETFDADETHLNVLTHGDFWINNIMYVYSDENMDKIPNDLKLIDFQFSSWTSPAIDLHYFFHTSMKNFKLDVQDEYLQYYYDILRNTLIALKCNKKIPSLSEFRIQFDEKSLYALSSATIIQPIMACEETSDADLNALVGTDERSKNFRKSVYTNIKTQNKIKSVLPIFDRRGLLDI